MRRICRKYHLIKHAKVVGQKFIILCLLQRYQRTGARNACEWGSASLLPANSGCPGWPGSKGLPEPVPTVQYAGQVSRRSPIFGREREKERR